MTYDKLFSEIKELDSQHAPGSETTLWGDFLESARKTLGVDPLSPECHEDVEVPTEFADHWFAEYNKLDETPTTDTTITIVIEIGSVDKPRMSVVGKWAAFDDNGDEERDLAQRAIAKKVSVVLEADVDRLEVNLYDERGALAVDDVSCGAFYAYIN